MVTWIVITLALTAPSSEAASSIESEASSAPISAPTSAPVAVTPMHGRSRDQVVRGTLTMIAAGAGTAIVAVPAMIALGSFLGSLSSNLVGALLPSALLLAIVPPLAITAVMWAVGDALHKDSVRFGPALGIAIGLQVAGIVIAVVGGASSGNIGSVVAYTVAEAVVLPLGVGLTMAVGRKDKGEPFAMPARDAFERQAQARLTPILSLGF